MRYLSIRGAAYKISFCFLVCEAASAQGPGGISSGLRLWLKADAGITAADATKISSWPDQSPIGYNLTQATTANQPTYYKTTAASLVNFNPSVNFVAADGAVLTNTTANVFAGAIVNGTGSSYQIITVAKDTSKQNIASPNFGNSSPHSILGNSNAGDNPAIDLLKNSTVNNGWGLLTNVGTQRINGNGTVYNGGGIGNGTMTLPSAYVNQLKNTQPQIFGAGYTVGNTVFSWIDGLKESSSLTPGINRITNTALFYVGTSGGTEFWSGPINEVIVYNRQLSDLEMQEVNSYLAIKYGVTLGQGNNSSTVPTYNVGFNAANYNYIASDASIVWNGTSNTSFAYNIAGIGRDDNSVLNQKQSQSVNYGNQVTVGLGTISTSNGGNTNNFFQNKIFSVWGDNGNASTLSSGNTALPYGGTSTSIRMNRVWLMQNTNVKQAVKISIPSSMLGVTVTSCQKLRLIVASNAGFTTSLSASTNLTANGSNYECYFTFPAGTSYFSFARIDVGTEGSVNIPSAVVPALAQGACVENGWTYLYSDAAKTKKLAAINKNGNTGLPNYNGTASGLNASVTYNASIYSATEGTSTTNIMQRLLTIVDPSAGTYTTNGGLKVRVYFDSTELVNAQPAGMLDSKWFKHPGSAASTIADLTPTTIYSVILYGGLTTGLEDTIHYIEFTGVQSLSTFGYVATNSSIPLPVVLSYFKARTDIFSVLLSWQTSQEENSQRFDIERRTRDTDSWQIIGTMNAAGSSSTVREYQFRDGNPSAGLNYYRLVQTDIDGKSQNSETLKIVFGKTGGWKTATVNPNPSVGNSTPLLLLDAATEENLQVTMYSVTGKILFQQKMSTGAISYQMDVPALPKGTYFIHVQSLHHDQTLKWFKQ